MSRPSPRRPSRAGTSRPRRLAGASRPDQEQQDQEQDLEPDLEPDDKADDEPHDEPHDEPDDEPDADDPVPAPSGILASRRVTRVLLVTVGVLVLALVLQSAWFLWHQSRNEEAPTPQAREEGERIAVPAERPFVMGQLGAQEGVEAAAAAAQTMFARNFEKYDEGVDEATALMTDRFAEDYRTTTDGVRQEFVDKQTVVEVRVVAQSVARANDAELEALIFLNQYVFRGKGEDATTTYTPYRALLTMVHTDEGWLVDDVETE